MRRLVVLSLAALVLVGCGGGVEIDAENKARADEMFDGLTTVQREGLCAALEDPEKAAQAAEEIQDELFDRTIDETNQAFTDGGSAEEWLSNVGQNSEQSTQEASDVVEYLRGRC